jgi:hypothetical protein
MEASGWAASAACSHHLTARVGHSRELYRHFDFAQGTKTNIANVDGTIRRTHVPHAWTNQYSMTNEHRNFGTASTAGTIRDQYMNVDVDLYGESRGRNDGQEDNVATQKVHQHGGDFRPLFQIKQQMFRDKMEEGHGRSFKALGNSMWVPIARGANVQSV